MLNILAVSIPKAEQILHLVHKATLSNMVVVILCAVIVILACLLFPHKEKITDTVFMICITCGLISLILSAYNGFEEDTEVHGDIDYERAMNISHQHPHLLVKSKHGKRYTALMSQAKQDGIDIYTPQWWQYL